MPQLSAAVVLGRGWAYRGNIRMNARIDKVGQVERLVCGESILRVMCASDLPALAAALADTDPRDQDYFSGLGAPQVSAADWLAWRATEIGRGRCYSLASFDSGDKLLGEVALSDLNLKPGHASLSYWVRSSVRRRRLGLAMAGAMCRYGFAHLALECIEIAVSPENCASQRLAHALGAKRVPGAAAAYDHTLFQLRADILGICRTHPS